MVKPTIISEAHLRKEESFRIIVRELEIDEVPLIEQVKPPFRITVFVNTDARSLKNRRVN